MRAWLARQVRALLARFAPPTSVNRITDAPALQGPVPVLVYFPTAPATSYQVEHWTQAFHALDERFGLAVLCRDSRVAAQLRAGTGLRTASVSTMAQVLDTMDRLDVRLVLYPNLDPLDFEPLADARATHVYIGHGDSAKKVFASRQVLAFDHYLVADSAAARRVEKALARPLPEGWLRVIGPSGLPASTWATPVDLDRPRVLYAPTWEGGAGGGTHSSLTGQGPALVERLCADDRIHVVYRPHPLTGVDDPAVAAVDRRLRDLVRRSGGVVAADDPLEQVLGGCAVLLADTSALVSLWRPSGRPLLLAGDPPENDGPRPETVVASVLALVAGHDYAAGPTPEGHPVPADLIATCDDLVAATEARRAP